MTLTAALAAAAALNAECLPFLYTVDLAPGGGWAVVILSRRR